MVLEAEIPPTASQRAIENADKNESTLVLRSKMSVITDLNRYLETTVGALRSEEERGAVSRLVEAVCSESASAGTWWALLHHEECHFERSGVNNKDYVKRSSTTHVILFDLYDWATRLVPQKGNKTKPAFVNIWLGHARQQWLRGQDDALDAIKALKTQQIGLSYAPMYIEWASIEAASGNVRKALSVVSKGIREQAQPLGHLEELERDLKADRFSYRPFWTFSVDESAPLAVDQPVGVPSSSAKAAATQVLESKTPRFVRESLNSISDRRSSGSSRGSSEEEATTSNMTLTLTANACPDRVAGEGVQRTREVPAEIHRTPGTARLRTPSHHQGISNVASVGANNNKSKLATPLSSSSLSARRSRITYNKVTSSCEKLAKSLRDDLTWHRPQVLHAIPEIDNNSSVAQSGAEHEMAARNPLIIDEVGNACNASSAGKNASNAGEDTSNVDGETLPIRCKGNRGGDVRGQSMAPIPPAPLFAHESGSTPAVNATPAVNSAVHANPRPQGIPAPLKPAAAASTPAPSSRPQSQLPIHAPPSQPSIEPINQAPQQPSRKVVENEHMVIVRGIQYTKLECVGKGGSSKVYKVMAPNKKIFALKRIRLNGRDQEAATGFLDEITLLARLRGKSNIIQLIDSEVHKRDGIIYMVLECGDIDLAKLLQRHEAALQERRRGNGSNGVTGNQPNAGEHFVDENFVRLYWEQMLHAVDTIHRERIVHSDLKPANFLVVEGQLKLIDFGIAKAIQADTTSIARESQVGTLNYMSPEAITGGSPATSAGGPATKVGRASDIWSLGCILYQMVYGKTPFAHLPFIQKMHAIIDDMYEIAFPPIANPHLLDVIKRCLHRQPKQRITMEELLEHPFLHPETAAANHTGSNPQANSIELSRDQLRTLLQKVATSGANADVNMLSDQLFLQLVGTTNEQTGEAARGGAGVDGTADKENLLASRPPPKAATLDDRPTVQRPPLGQSNL